MNRTLGSAPTAQLAGSQAASGQYGIRQVRPTDADLIRDFVCGLSLQTQYLRFFTTASPPGSGLLRALTGQAGDGRSDILLIIDKAGSVVGHGMAVDVSQDGVLCSDIGLVIADQWQRRGLGSALLALIADRAAERGVAALVLEVLPENARMLALVSKFWPQASRRRTQDALVITVPLTARSLPGAGNGGRPAPHDRPAPAAA